MNTTAQEPTPSSRRVPFWLVILLLAAIPSGYFYVSGRLDRTALQREVDELVQQNRTLADSLDGARTHLILGAALTTVRGGDFETARQLTSDFFDRVDGRTRIEGVGPEDTEARMEILGLRDRTISALSTGSPEADMLLEDLAALHLSLADPELKGRMPDLQSPSRAQDTLRTNSPSVPGIYPLQDTHPK